MTDAPDIRDKIEAAINKILADSGRDMRNVNDGDSLTMDLGLDSLDLAVLVVTLEHDLGVDPFRDGSGAVQTLGDLVAVYVEALES